MGKTERLTADAEGATRTANVMRAAAILRAGGTVALPTETVYGLGANALSAEAVEKIFAAKERPKWDPLIVHVCDVEMARTVAEVSELAERLAAKFWPGPLTMLLPRRACVPDAVTAAMLSEFGAVEVFSSIAAGTPSEEAPAPAPGVGLRHYAPRARLVLVERKSGEDLRGFWHRFKQAGAEQAGVVGWMLPERFSEMQEDERTLIYKWGEWTDAEALAARLFAGLRDLDARGAEVIVCPMPGADGIGDAVRDRLRKAAVAAE